MKYQSTRGYDEEIDSAEAILKGIATDGGLFIPEEIPRVTKKFLAELPSLSYKERAQEILALFLTDYSGRELEECVSGAYGNNKFDDAKIAPSVNLSDDTTVLELWHGPTSAFKDMALQLLPRLLTTAQKKVNETKDALILVATSGDTGKAALSGFADVDKTKIMVFYPKDGVSAMQERQMVTQTGNNVGVVAVKGNFDDAQTGVKKIFGDADFAVRLLSHKAKLSSANSINWGRLVPQIVYYFSAYADLIQSRAIKPGDKVNFCVPTGNFGNILAGYYALCMGLPVNKLICASNANNVLTEFLQTGVYNRNRQFYKTISPSMDILISSNLERLLAHLTGNTVKIRGWMGELARMGQYTVGSEILGKLNGLFWGGCADDERTRATIKKISDEYNYVVDPHTAVAFAVAADYRAATNDKHRTVIVSTASPYKFPADVLSALGEDTSGKDDFALLDMLREKSKRAIPPGLAALKDLPVIHTASCVKEKMSEAVTAFAAGKNL